MREHAPTIVVVDDDVSVRRGLARLLRSAGYRAETFASAPEFLERGAGDDPACLVLDVRMPGLSGFDLHEVLVGEGLDVPVVFITGHADGPMAVRAVKPDGADILAKPFDGQALLDAVEQALTRAGRGLVRSASS
ncbi:MAG TPA: response regulator [Methylomirabilota bacterium]|nr:response regulator [Methylomirabilota bacterium]